MIARFFAALMMQPIELSVIRRAGRHAREERGGGFIRLKILGKRAEGLFRENRIPVLLALALADEHRHAGGIDVTYLEVSHLADAES